MAGKIVIMAEEMEANCNSEIVKFDPVVSMSESANCFFIIYRNVTLGKYTPIYKSETRAP